MLRPKLVPWVTRIDLVTQGQRGVRYELVNTAPTMAGKSLPRRVARNARMGR
eukprot:SAG11_NODE_16444_length_547_cov_0.919643_1_plen_51_part_01